MTENDRLVPWTHSPAEMGRLERAMTDELSTLDARAALRRMTSLRNGRERGELEVYLWEHRAGSAQGFVACRSAAHVGRRVAHLFLETGFRDPASLDSLFGLLEHLPAEPDPVVASTDFVLGVPLDAQIPVLVPRGFVHVDQQRMVFRADRALPQEAPSAPGLWRHPTSEDIEPLIDLFVRAYRTDPTQLEWPQLRLREDAAYFVRGVFDRESDFDPLVPEWSFVTEQEGVLLGAILVLAVPTEGPFFSDLMVDPSVRRKGIGRQLMVRALSAARAARPDADIRLTVETQNRPAYELYTSLGFVPMAPQPGQRSGVWLRRVTAERVTGTQSGWDLGRSSGTATVPDPRGYVRAPTSSPR